MRRKKKVGADEEREGWRRRRRDDKGWVYTPTESISQKAKDKRRAQGRSICDHAMTDVEKTTKGKAARSEPRLVSGIQGVLGE
ncbi:unnamed protein product [Fusarium graminearum]|nr:unnamed protein product [Fusarium graminearum]CAG2013635.1 unnamed protein product [Fusarium graminearum]